MIILINLLSLFPNYIWEKLWEVAMSTSLVYGCYLGWKCPQMQCPLTFISKCVGFVQLRIGCSIQKYLRPFCLASCCFVLINREASCHSTAVVLVTFICKSQPSWSSSWKQEEVGMPQGDGVAEQGAALGFKGERTQNWWVQLFLMVYRHHFKTTRNHFKWNGIYDATTMIIITQLNCSMLGICSSNPKDKK